MSFEQQARKHSGVTLLISWIIWNIIATILFVIEVPMAILPFGILFIAIEVWYLKVKNRSLWFLLLNLLNWIGLVFMLSLSDNSHKLQKVVVVEE